MILKHILFKNFILKTIKNNYNIVDIILFTKQLTLLYIICYNQSILNTQILFINHYLILNNDLKLSKLYTNNPYIYNKKIDNFINNWKILKKQILLLKWITYLIILINKNKINLPFISLIKLFKKFIILKNNYWSIIHLKNPSYIFIFSKYFTNNLFKNYVKFTKQLFFIIISSTKLYLIKKPILIIPNFLCFKLILELIITAYVQGKYYFIK